MCKKKSRAEAARDGLAERARQVIESKRKGFGLKARKGHTTPEGQRPPIHFHHQKDS